MRASDAAGPGSQKLFDLLRRSPEHRAVAPLDDGALDEVRVLGHEADDLLVGEFARGESKLFVDRLARAQKLARAYAHLADQLAQLPLAERLGDVVYFLVSDAALTEQAVGLAALGSSRLLVDGDFVGHSF